MNAQDVATATHKFTLTQRSLQGSVDLLLLAHSDGRKTAVIKRNVADQIARVERELAGLREAVGAIAGA